MFKKKIKKLVEDSLLCLKKENCKAPQRLEIIVKYPPKEEYGDYSVILREDFAKEVQKEIMRKKVSWLDRVEFLSPSFLNFYIKEDHLKKELRNIFKKGEKFGLLNVGKKQRVNIEFISANPTGNLHIGHGRGAFFGDVLASLLSFSGFKVDREYYINDAKNSNQIIELGKTGCGEGITYLTKDLEQKIKNQKSKIKKIIERTRAKEEAYKEVGFLLSREILKDIKNLVEKKLKIKFDRWFSEEEELIKKRKVEKVLSLLKKRNLIYKRDGALWLKTSKYGDIQDWVIVRKNGRPTYFLSDIAYHLDKIKRGYKKIIDIWGADHQGHVGRMKAVMRMLNYKGEYIVFISQIVNLKGGEKISKRKGNVIYLEDLVKEVGLDVARYFYISKSLSSQMEFDLKLAKEHSEKNPVFYVQYAYVRANSIINKAKKLGIKVNLKNLKLLDHKNELKLLKEIIKFPEIIEETTKDFQIQRLTEYARSIASIFNQFYRDCKVIEEDKKISEARLCLVFATKIVLSNLLSLIGISRPEKM